LTPWPRVENRQAVNRCPHCAADLNVNSVGGLCPACLIAQGLDEPANEKADGGGSLLPSGTRIGQYKILAPLGAGGMGQVYRARDARLSRDVALKILSPGLAGDPALCARFESEARIVGSLNHPNIVTVFDIGRDDEFVYIASELVEGESLRAV